MCSCSLNLPRVYIRLCKHGNHFTFLLWKEITDLGTLILNPEANFRQGTWIKLAELIKKYISRI